MIRTSVVLPPALHKELEITSHQEGRTVTDLIRQAVEQAMTARRQTQVKAMYRTLRTLEGTGSPDITDASTTINDVLYGEEGTWKGKSA